MERTRTGMDGLHDMAAGAADYIGRFADMLERCRGDAFEPRVTRLGLANGFELCCIEPPCGSNTFVLKKGGALMFVDGGFACYAPEMRRVLLGLFPDFDTLSRRMCLTHPDEDHCGLVRWFDEIYVTRLSWAHFRLENEGQPNFRQQNPDQARYSRVACALSGYRPPRMESLRVVEGAPDDPEAPICRIGSVDFCGRRFDFYRGNGGHAVGEAVIVDEADRLVFSGDLQINVGGCIPLQAEYNRIALEALPSVNMDSARFRAERRALLERFSPMDYYYCCGHGAIMAPGKGGDTGCAKSD